MGQQTRTEEKRLAAEDQEPLLKARGGEAMEATSVKPLTKLRTAVFPIYGSQEVTKFLLLGSIKFFIILALTLTRDTKDTLVVTQCGAEAIAFLKVSSMIPLQMRHFDAFKP
jgi:ATP/ADP translocase